MKTPTIRLKRSLEVTMSDALKRYDKLDGLNKKAIKEEYKEWIDALEGDKAQPYVLYVNQINIEEY
tara:strand:+ start:141 stop:338 length:198 start_codon:yes stop_codon:yes gene_type:complete